MEKYGEDWDDFRTIVDDNVDYVMNKTYQLYWLNNVDYMGVREVEKALLSMKIGTSSSETLPYKKEKLRKFLTIFANKGTADIYLDFAESVAGARGDIYMGYNLGVWRWGTSRWGIPGAPTVNDLRWTLQYARFYVLIDVKTTDSSELDQITSIFRESYLLPAFYQIYLIDSSFNILRTI
jgi:hypothetical protein